MTKDEVRQLAKALLPVFQEVIDSRALRYEGIHKSGQEYAKNAIVTRGGTIWFCQAVKTTAAPGDDSGHWKLMVKSCG